MTLTASDMAFPAEAGISRRGVSRLLTSLGILTLAAALPAAAGTFSPAETGTRWNNGGSLCAALTVDRDGIAAAPLSAVPAGASTGENASGGFPGLTYLYNVPGFENNDSFSEFDCAQTWGCLANQIVLSGGPEPFRGQYIDLDWQGISPGSFWLLGASGPYSFEDTTGEGGWRFPNVEGGFAGAATPDAGPSGDDTPQPGMFLGSGLMLIAAGCFHGKRSRGI